jgi:hypothetical protein
MIPNQRYNGDDTLYMGVTALLHEQIHVVGGSHIWLADGSCNNVMHPASLPCSLHSVPPISSMTIEQVRAHILRKVKEGKIK